ncbi:hypothetical protein D3C76_1346540 [compost metagenome]
MEPVQNLCPKRVAGLQLRLPPHDLFDTQNNLPVPRMCHLQSHACVHRSGRRHNLP